MSRSLQRCTRCSRSRSATKRRHRWLNVFLTYLGKGPLAIWARHKPNLAQDAIVQHGRLGRLGVLGALLGRLERGALREEIGASARHLRGALRVSAHDNVVRKPSEDGVASHDGVDVREGTQAQLEVVAGL